MPELAGNLLVAQSGGPTAVINASLAGVIQEAGRHDCIEEIYGGSNGILGILNEDLIDINDQKAKTIEGLRYTPAAALGTCRYKIDFKKKPEQAAKDMDRLFEVFQAHTILSRGSSRRAGSTASGPSIVISIIALFGARTL